MSKLNEVFSDEFNEKIDREYWQRKAEEIESVVAQQKAMYGENINNLLNELNYGR